MFSLANKKLCLANFLVKAIFICVHVTFFIIRVSKRQVHQPEHHRHGRKEGNVLFNDALNTFYLQLFGIRHMVKDHWDRERGNPLPPHGLLFPINSKGFYMHHPTYRIAHTTAFVTPVVEHWQEREIAQWVHPMKDRSIAPWANALPLSYVPLLFVYMLSFL